MQGCSDIFAEYLFIRNKNKMYKLKALDTSIIQFMFKSIKKDNYN